MSSEADNGISQRRVSLVDSRLAILLVPLALFVLFAWSSWREAQLEAKADASRATAALAEHAQRVFEVQETLLSAALDFVRGREADDIARDRRVHEIFANLVASSSASRGLILVHGDTGRMVAWNRAFPALDVDLSRRDYVLAQRDRVGEAYVSEVIRTEPTGEIGFTLSRRDPASDLIAVSRMPLDDFQNFYASLRGNDSDVINLLREDGVMLVRDPPLASGQIGIRLPPQAPFWQLKPLAEPREPLVMLSALDRAWRLIHLRKVQGYPVYVLYGMDYVAVRNAWLRQLLPFTLLMLATSAALLWMASRLQRAARNAAAAQAEVRSRDALTAANVQLRDSEARYRLLFENNPNPMWVYDRETLRFLAVNDAAITLYGYESEEFLKMSVLDIRPPEDVPRLLHDLAAKNEDVRRPGIRRHRKKSGEIIEVDIAAHVIDFAGRNAVAVLIHDVTAQQAAEMALRESEARFRNMADHAPVMVWTTEPDGSCTYLSKSWYEFTGLPAGAGLGFDCLAPAHPDDRPTVEREFNAANAERRVYRAEYRMRRYDGAWRWVIDAASPRLGSDGSHLGYVGSIIDITERKLSEEHIQLLMREVNHRSKNILSLVQAVARQTAATDPNDFVERFSERVQALAKSQDLLVKNEWQGVGLHELVRSQLAHFEDLIGLRIHLHGPALRLSAAAAQTLAMALHELATNAGKYGALSNDAGSVSVFWNLARADDGKARFILCWTERNGPPVVAPTRRGFGSTVVGAMSKMSLDADVALDFAPEGLRWRLDCPADMVLEAGMAARGSDATSPGEELARAKRRVLLVEDEALLALDLADHLQDANFTVIGPAASVAQALKLIDTVGCDVAVLDVNLGAETTEPIALDLLARRIPFVAVTGYSRAQQPPAFVSAPVLSKPVNMQILIATLDRCLAQQPVNA